MKTGKTFRRISLVMLIAAAVFVFCALLNPALGKTIYIGSFVFSAEQWRFCYKVYAIVMVGLFVTSFLVKEKSKHIIIKKLNRTYSFDVKLRPSRAELETVDKMVKFPRWEERVCGKNRKVVLRLLNQQFSELF